jgi:hypothetical protein
MLEHHAALGGRHRCARPLSLGGDPVADTRRQIELDVGTALECAEAATWTANELVARTLETAVTGREAATTLHHAYSAQVHVARVLEWSKECPRARRRGLTIASRGCAGLATTPRNSADASRCRSTPVARLQGSRNGQRDGRKITGKPKAVLKNRWQQSSPASRQLSDCSRDHVAAVTHFQPIIGLP